MKLKLTLLFLLCVANAWLTPLFAKPVAPYALKTIQKASTNKGFDIVRLFNTKTRKVIWTRKFPFSTDVIGWSKDGKALAIYIRWDTILIWRLGYKTRFFKAPVEEDYIMAFIWSPDNRRLLIRSGSSGASETPQSHLFCLNVESKRMYDIGITANESWLSNRKVQYSVLVYEAHKDPGYYEIKKIVWHSP